jgi:hypothetical protein
VTAVARSVDVPSLNNAQVVPSSEYSMK